MFKVADHRTLSSVVKIFGNGLKDQSINKYNEFVTNLSNSDICKDILNKITSSNIGIQLEDCFIPQSDLEYRWKIVKNWEGYVRLTKEFKFKHDE